MRMNHNQNMLNQSMANPASINRSPIDHRPTNISIANNTRNASYNDDKQKMENMSNDLMKLKSQLNNIMTKADSAQI